MKSIDITKLLKDQCTYPSWVKGNIFSIHTENVDNYTVNVYYDIGKRIRRRKQRLFPRYIPLTPGFCWALGFFKGEGVNSIINGSYRRFSVINKNPKYIKKFLDEMFNSNLLPEWKIEQRCFQIHHFANRQSKAKRYWAMALNIPEERIAMVNNKQSLKKKGNGVCRFDISDVLLRRIVDLISEGILNGDLDKVTSE